MVSRPVHGSARVVIPWTPVKIKAFRTDMRMSQPEFGVLVGVHSQTISRWEQGTWGPFPYSKRSLDKAAASMNWPPEHYSPPQINLRCDSCGRVMGEMVV